MFHFPIGAESFYSGSFTLSTISAVGFETSVARGGKVINVERTTVAHQNCDGTVATRASPVVETNLSPCDVVYDSGQSSHEIPWLISSAATGRNAAISHLLTSVTVKPVPASSPARINAKSIASSITSGINASSRRIVQHFIFWAFYCKKRGARYIGIN